MRKIALYIVQNYIIPLLTKLYLLLIVGIIFVAVFIQNPIDFRGGFDIRAIGTFALYFLSMAGNIFNSTLYKFPLAGPWWYFSLIAQCYLLFPFLYYLICRYRSIQGFYIILCLSYFLIYALQPIANYFDIALHANIVGHLPVFILGIGVAKHKNLHLTWKVLIPCFIVYVLANFYEIFFPLGTITACIILLAMLYPIIQNTSSKLSRFFIFIGSISMYMFILNGPLREFTIYGIIPGLSNQTPLEILRNAFVHLFIVIIVSYLMSILYRKYIHPLEGKIISFLSNFSFTAKKKK